MGKLDDLRSSLSFFIKREYSLDRWIGDESLLSILHTQYHIISPDIKNKKRIQLINEIGSYFGCIRTKNIFGCKAEESVYDCLSNRIDLLDDVMKNNIPISLIIKKSDQNSDEFSPEQVNTTIHRAEYLRLTYMNVL